MKRINIILLLLFLMPFNNLIAGEIKYNLRRFDRSFYENNSSSDLKERIEKRNREESEIRSVQRKPVKNGRYEGVYKVGNPYTVLGQTYRPREDPNYKETGMASWYGSDFHGKKTANGETYNMYDYTAAHRTLPMPCMVKITNLENGKSIKVRVNDRGPFTKDRIIDVSKHVATKLGFHHKGTTKVKVEFLKKETEEMLRDFGIR